MEIWFIVHFVNATQSGINGICSTFACRCSLAFFVNGPVFNIRHRVVASQQTFARSVLGVFCYAAADFVCVILHNLREMTHEFAATKE